MATGGTLRKGWLEGARGSARPAQLAARGVVPTVAGLTAGILILRMAWDSAGYFPPSYLSNGAIAFLVCGVLVAVARPRAELSTNAFVAIGALAALGAWTGLSALWSPSPDTGIEAMQRDLAYVGFLGLAVLAAGSGRYARHLVWGVLTVIAVICCAGLISRLFPDVIHSHNGLASANYRLAYPFTYWNAFGALCSVGAVLAFGLCADVRTPWPLRGAAAGLTVLFAVTMYLSLSRGAWMALFAGLVVVVLLSANRGSLLLSAGVVGLLSALAIARLRGYHALTDNPRIDQGQQAAGHAYAGQLVVLVAIAVGAQAIIGAARSSDNLMVVLDRMFRKVLIAIAGAIVVVLACGYLLRAADAEGFAARGLHSASGWVSRQWDDFLQPAGTEQSGSARLTSATGTRSDLYRVALHGFSAHPLWGDGAGGFETRWLRERRETESVQNAHSLEIETLGETGLIGLLLLAAFIAAIVAAAVRSRIRPGGLARAQVAAVAGACAVWLVHSFVDWDWQQPALTAPVFVLAATLFPYGRGRRRRRRPRSHELMETPVPAAAAEPTRQRTS